MLLEAPYEVVNKVPMTCYKGPKDSKLCLVHTEQEWDAFFDLLMKKNLVACDTETNGFKYYAGHKIVGMSFGWDDWHFYIPVRHEDSCLESRQPLQLSMDTIKEDLIKFFSRKDVFTIWHHSCFDRHFYRADGIDIKTPFHDTIFLWKFYDENAPASLKTIASGWTDDMGRRRKGLIGPEANEKEKELTDWRLREARARKSLFKNLVKEKSEELFTKLEHQDKTKTELKKYIVDNEIVVPPIPGFLKEDVHYGFVPIPLMVEYACVDTYLTYALYKFLMKNLVITPALNNLYINELKLSMALFDAEEAGSKIDRDYLVQLGQDLHIEASQLEKDIKYELGDINLNSNNQLSQALVNKGINLTKKTATGALSVDNGVLSKLASKHEVVDKFVKLRKITKLNSTYVEGILNKLTNDNILHCSFNQNVSTGRMSSHSPNLQNIPGKDDRIKEAFIIPNNDYIYVFADYSQVEVRLTAHYSRDPLLLDSYHNKQDVHTRTMCEMFNFNYDEVHRVISSEDTSHPEYAKWNLLRRTAKIINFGIIYGVSAEGLSKQIPRPEQYKDLEEHEWVDICRAYIDQYFRKYIGVKRFINQSNRTIRKKCYLENYFGRPRHLPHAKADILVGDKYRWMISRAKRQGTNYLIQGTAADVFKIAVVRVHELFKGKKSYMVNFVHDEIQSYIHKDEFYLLKDMKKVMEDFDFIVPLVADFGYSTTNWADKKKI